jgi:hypothetical protein
MLRTSAHCLSASLLLLCLMLMCAFGGAGAYALDFNTFFDACAFLFSVCKHTVFRVQTQPTASRVSRLGGVACVRVVLFDAQNQISIIILALVDVMRPAVRRESTDFPNCRFAWDFRDQ